MITVGELVAKLQALPQEMLIWVTGCCESGPAYMPFIDEVWISPPLDNLMADGKDIQVVKLKPDMDAYHKLNSRNV